MDRSGTSNVRRRRRVEKGVGGAPRTRWHRSCVLPRHSGARGRRITRHSCASSVPRKISPACICAASGGRDPRAAEAPVLAREPAPIALDPAKKLWYSCPLSSPLSHARSRHQGGGATINNMWPSWIPPRADAPPTAAAQQAADDPSACSRSSQQARVSRPVTPQLLPPVQRTRVAARRPGSAAL